jgi:hypothetical protein
MLEGKLTTPEPAEDEDCVAPPSPRPSTSQPVGIQFGAQQNPSVRHRWQTAFRDSPDVPPTRTPPATVAVEYPFVVHREWGVITLSLAALTGLPLLWLAVTRSSVLLFIVAMVLSAAFTIMSRLTVTDLDGEQCVVRVGALSQSFLWSSVKSIRTGDAADTGPIGRIKLPAGTMYSVSTKSSVRIELDNGETVLLGVADCRAVLAAMLAAHKRVRGRNHRSASDRSTAHETEMTMHS